MITVGVLVTRLPGLQLQDLDYWIAQDWVRPDDPVGHFMFREVDVARVKLIRELRRPAGYEEALPLVLSLLDQLYDMRRRRMRELGDALGRVVPEDVRQSLADELASR